MGRWTQYDEDSYRLPEGMVRTGYDADTGTYTYRSRSGGTYAGAPHTRYGVLTPRPVQTPSFTPHHRRSRSVAVPSSYTSNYVPQRTASQLSRNETHVKRSASALIPSRRALSPVTYTVDDKETFDVLGAKPLSAENKRGAAVQGLTRSEVGQRSTTRQVARNIMRILDFARRITNRAVHINSLKVRRVKSDDVVTDPVPFMDL